jgi:YD repeat-containing protein
MKKAFAVSMALLLCLSAIALATEDNDKGMQGKNQNLQGTITKVDAATKMLTIRDTSGTETTVYWDESTRVSGDLKEGSSVQLTAFDKDGKKLASSINVKAPPKNY